MNINYISCFLNFQVQPDRLMPEQLKVTKKQTRAAHNLIEKRYRGNINSKIIKLKHIIAGEESKMNKPLILKSVIDRILALQERNVKLKYENLTLSQNCEASDSTEWECTEPSRESNHSSLPLIQQADLGDSLLSDPYNSQVREYG